MAKNNEYTPEFTEKQTNQDYKTVITLQNLTFDITANFITNLKSISFHMIKMKHIIYI